ncbi:hypothetical protein XENTR_v10015733 [Xenopus tropicalis]|uniref:Probable ubiquitin carboxyl-terminal hydrolase MINDY-4 n=2 Tax=Xenopus tropicalis TaxID=8364 RepID=MINY4_XENTR|nr:probable ubiquitin carboxyl-terminal hydrolase MINDY-4 [Xenopus tropicalis]Q0VA42.1 RecName: Full=Probable ubiquitin carboxyl-terminal hydrolase MINDY-4; AltName: Full=Probable deubiquitinating enzyme MINDY-4 [Xenopus tropicalis]AAI21262.1 UPF0526 protein [Xenopus tropicalis]KAE8595412.1 hypothetical protein XENTR_v10015733 [Xenopus tropicalis]KAE8595413.1 hypothetical protein XENTR_v10015733 [Xenopus tropicalis]KAE8595414.1 hypothetical protein XENTR_v10015733 [Xenopus tropicalis]|eukprot:NP_001072940.1 probable ubiquitin carboxyl-terminal hydrolase MINDY-4 [Xenopus tropicalis]
MEICYVQEVASSLVREFLSRKGLKKTSLTLEEELPRAPRSISTRNELRAALHLDRLYKENKLTEKPLKTLLEIMTKYFLEHSGKTKALNMRGEQNPAPPKGLATNLQQRHAGDLMMAVCDVSDDETGESSAVSDTSKTEIYRSQNDLQFNKSNHLKGPDRKQKQTEAGVTSTGVCSEGELMPPRVNIREHQERESWEMALGAKSSRSETQRPRSSRMVRGMMSGPTASSQEDSLKKRGPRRSAAANTPNPIKGEVLSEITGGMGEPSTIAPANTALKLGKEFAAKLLSTSENLRNVSLCSTNAVPKPNAFAAAETAADGKGATEASPYASNEHRRRSGFSNMDLNSASLAKKTLPFHRERNDKEDLKLDDVEDCLVTEEIRNIPTALPGNLKQIEGKPIDLAQAVEIKKILFGSSFCCFSDEWKIQSFTFNNNQPLRYGFIQKKGGPCGVLAAVQGCVLKNLLFGKDADLRVLQPSDSQRTSCLCKAIADILWRAGDNKEAVVALSCGRPQFSPAGRYKADGILESLILYKIRKYEDLMGFVQQHISQFELGPFGCTLLTLSVVLSRSVELVQKDFDVSTNCLIGAHSYCTQELVNLILSGRAVSNVFNDVVELDSGNGNITLLRGVAHRTDIGFLSLFEHYNVCQVGSYLKTPRFPIWVICSESHFSVLFCVRRELMSDWKMERRFDLYYYDGLANQQDEIRLTVDTAATYIEEQENDLTPPLEHCIRTKWKGAVIDWNGTEPIL